MFFVKVRPANFADSNLRAFADVSVGGVTIKNVKVVEGKDGLFASMPSVKDKNGQYQPVCYVDKDIRQAFNDAVVAAYNQTLEHDVKQESAPQEPAPDQTDEPQPVEEPEPILEQAM